MFNSNILGPKQLSSPEQNHQEQNLLQNTIENGDNNENLNDQQNFEPVEFDEQGGKITNIINTQHVDITLQNLQDKQYVENENKRIESDEKDKHDLEAQIQKLRKMKNQFSSQKQQIRSLSKIVSTLKSQNQTLRHQKQSQRSESLIKQPVSTHQIPLRRLQTFGLKQKSVSKQNIPSEKKIVQNERRNKIYGYLQNQEIAETTKNTPLHSISGNYNGYDRYASPQIGKRMLNKSSNYSQHPIFEHLYSPRKQISSHIPAYNPIPSNSYAYNQHFDVTKHQANKRTVISAFVDNLKDELQKNDLELRSQQRLHRQTRDELQHCLENYESLKLRSAAMQHDCDKFQLENGSLRQKLEIEISERMLYEQKYYKRQMQNKQQHTQYLMINGQIDQELDRMDEIFYQIQKVILM